MAIHKYFEQCQIRVNITYKFTKQYDISLQRDSHLSQGIITHKTNRMFDYLNDTNFKGP